MIYALRVYVAVLVAVLCGLCSGCAWLAGARPAISLESDRQLVADARGRVEVVRGAAETAGHRATAQLLAGAGESLRTIQSGPVGTVEASPWPPAVVEAVRREQAGEVRVEERLVPDPALEAALARTEAERARWQAESEQAHGRIQALGREVASRWTPWAVKAATGATGSGALLLGLLAAARRYAPAIRAAVDGLQAAKRAAEAGRVATVEEIITPDVVTAGPLRAEHARRKAAAAKARRPKADGPIVRARKALAAIKARRRPKN